MKILIVEGNKQEALFLTKGMTETGYTVDHADNGRDGMFMAVSEFYDAIVMESGPPGGIDALGIIVTLRKEGNKTPIIVVSTRSAVADRIVGFKKRLRLSSVMSH